MRNTQQQEVLWQRYRNAKRRAIQEFLEQREMNENLKCMRAHEGVENLSGNAIIGLDCEEQMPKPCELKVVEFPFAIGEIKESESDDEREQGCTAWYNEKLRMNYKLQKGNQAVWVSWNRLKEETFGLNDLYKQWRKIELDDIEKYIEEFGEKLPKEVHGEMFDEALHCSEINTRMDEQEVELKWGRIKNQLRQKNPHIPVQTAAIVRRHMHMYPRMRCFHKPMRFDYQMRKFPSTVNKIGYVLNVKGPDDKVEDIIRHQLYSYMNELRIRQLVRIAKRNNKRQRTRLRKKGIFKEYSRSISKLTAQYWKKEKEQSDYYENEMVMRKREHEFEIRKMKQIWDKVGGAKGLYKTYKKFQAQNEEMKQLRKSHEELVGQVRSLNTLNDHLNEKDQMHLEKFYDY